MRFWPKEERLPGNGLCFLCQSSPQVAEGVKVIDTEFNFRPNGHHPLKGRKLVCERCAEDMAKLLGFVKVEDLEAFNLRQATAAQELGALRDRVSSVLASVDEELSHVPQPPRIQGVADSVVEKETEEDNGS